jgi:type IV pilus assembly protein PilA
MKVRREKLSHGCSRALRCGSAGFSLIEVLVVIVVILIISAIAIPRLLSSKMAANEAAAVAALRSIATVEVAYETTYSQGYAPSLDALGPPPPATQPSAAKADLIDEVLASTIRNGYHFDYKPIDSAGTGKPDAFTVNANPISPGQTGQRYFFVDQSNVIRWSLGGPAGPNSTPVPQ